MTESFDPGLQILPTPKKRASYRPAALRTTTPHDMKNSTYAYGASPSSSASQQSTFDTRIFRTGTNSSTYYGAGADVTRQHWTPDSSTSSCSACPTQFSFLERKHHCRRCGNIFCSAHSRYTVTLNVDASFSQTGQTSRACPRCRREFELWVNPPNVRRPSGSHTAGMANGSSGSANAGGVRPVRVRRTHKSGTGLARTGGNGDEEDDGDEHEDDEEDRGLPAASVPTDWTWSTF